jgi:hydrogenase expression/formation protein HypD
MKIVDEVYEICDRPWRGLGIIPNGGLRLREAWSDFDAQKRFSISGLLSTESVECESGDVLTGRIKPNQCKAFGVLCTPERPLGAPMVSSEGACAAYYRYSRAFRSGELRK